MSSGKIGFEHRGIGESLANNRFVVPLNQREYSWETEHVRALFEDFANAITQNKGTYFLGTVVLTQGDKGTPEVSDGQQRLATTTILLAAVRDYWHWNGDPKRAQALENQYLLTTDIETTENSPKLRLNVDDNIFFTKFVLSPPNSSDRKVEPTRESHRRIKNATVIASDFVKSILEPHSNGHKTARLLEWLEFVRSGAEVILLSVPDHMNAFMMFETLNDRGLKASQADLLKNHLLNPSCYLWK